MSSVLNIALSGLHAAETRLANSANNIANANSTQSVKDGAVVKEPYTPTRVTQISLSEGGVETRIVPDSNPAVPVNDPSNSAADANGVTQYPNVDLAQEEVDQITAGYDFQANLKILQADKNMFQKLLDIFS
jgi:flagellar basal-body rod protein FlgC